MLKALKLEQDYLLLSLHGAEEEEKKKILTRLKEISSELKKLQTTTDDGHHDMTKLREEYEYELEEEDFIYIQTIKTPPNKGDKRLYQYFQLKNGNNQVTGCYKVQVITPEEYRRIGRDLIKKGREEEGFLLSIKQIGNLVKNMIDYGVILSSYIKTGSIHYSDINFHLDDGRVIEAPDAISFMGILISHLESNAFTREDKEVILVVISALYDTYLEELFLT